MRQRSEGGARDSDVAESVAAEAGPMNVDSMTGIGSAGGLFTDLSKRSPAIWRASWTFGGREGT